jgi:Ion channel
MKENKLTPFTSLIDRLKIRDFVLIFIAITLLFAGFYFYISKVSPLNGLVLPDNSDQHATVSFEDALYFSIVTETTLGYGDIRPIGYSRWAICIQVFLGLVLAGMIVAKITSTQGKQIRSIARLASGYWIEPFQKPGQSTMLTIAKIYYDGEYLRYDGDNFNHKGEYEGYFKSQLISYDGNLLEFKYSNNPSLTHLFDKGFMNIKFENKENEKQYTSHEAVCIDSAKNEQIRYIGFRATKLQIEILQGSDLKNKKKLIQKIINDYDKSKY